MPEELHKTEEPEADKTAPDFSAQETKVVLGTGVRVKISAKEEQKTEAAGIDSSKIGLEGKIRQRSKYEEKRMQEIEDKIENKEELNGPDKIFYAKMLEREKGDNPPLETKEKPTEEKKATAAEKPPEPELVVPVKPKPSEKETLREQMIKEAGNKYEQEAGKKEQFVAERLNDNVLKNKRQEKINAIFDGLSERQRQKRIEEYNELMQRGGHKILSPEQVKGLVVAGVSLDAILTTKYNHWWSKNIKSGIKPGEALSEDDFDKEVAKIIEAGEQKIKDEALQEIGKIWDDKHDYWLKQIPQKIDDEIKAREELAAKKNEELAKIREQEQKTELINNLKASWDEAKELDKVLKSRKYKYTTKEGEVFKRKADIEKIKSQLSDEIINIADKILGERKERLREEAARESGYNPKATKKDKNLQEKFRRNLTDKIKKMVEASRAAEPEANQDIRARRSIKESQPKTQEEKQN